jgi:hypothetical protein
MSPGGSALDPRGHQRYGPYRLFCARYVFSRHPQQGFGRIWIASGLRKLCERGGRR